MMEEACQEAHGPGLLKHLLLCILVLGCAVLSCSVVSNYL